MKPNHLLLAQMLALVAVLSEELPPEQPTTHQRQRLQRTDDDISARQRKRRDKLARRAARFAAEQRGDE